jgi:YHS domain-containing protein
VQDPEVHLNELGVKLPCVVDPSRQAILDAEHRVLVNHEVYFFSSDEAKARFLKNPRKWCGLVTDPVSRARFEPVKASPRTTYAGRLYYFSSPETLESFLAMPERYKDPTRTMPEM